MARYGYVDSAETLAFTTDSAGTVLDAVVPLPGGVLLTVRPGGNVWSYPDVAGNYAAVANGADAKQGATTIYDPPGNVVSGTIPDNLTGNLQFR